MKLKTNIKPLNKATDSNSKELLSAGVNINIPPKTWLYMGLAVGIPAVVIILLLTFKDFVTK